MLQSDSTMLVVGEGINAPHVLRQVCAAVKGMVFKQFTLTQGI